MRCNGNIWCISLPSKDSLKIIIVIQVQALYQHSSLGTRIQLSLVRLTLLRAQPATLPPHAERGKLLDAFCAYQRSLNVDDDDDPQHWDMALLLSGLVFWVMYY